MDNAGAVRAVECVRDLHADLQHLGERQRAFLQTVGERLSFE